WYRYHRLFADLLRHRLETESQIDVAQLHTQASRWYMENGSPADGVRHALAAGDWERAGALIAVASDGMMKRGQVVTLLGWFKAMPEEVVRASPQLCMERSWPLIMTDQVDAAELYLALVEQATQEQGDSALQGGVAVARAFIARMRGDNQRAVELSERALALLPQDELGPRSIVGLTVGIAQWYRAQMAEAEQTLAGAERAGRESGNDYARFAALFFLNRVRMARGKLHQGADVCRQIIR
ncbi:MAG: hypothetical protein GY824_26760, partial [Delftia sp.]|nr:hypothetical protein [Delftia sp.]